MPQVDCQLRPVVGEDFGYLWPHRELGQDD